LHPALRCCETGLGLRGCCFVKIDKGLLLMGNQLEPGAYATDGYRAKGKLWVDRL
jgi:hypothetical protein